jgi:hypothetical protein
MTGTKSSLYAIPVYEVHLKRSRRPLRLAESCLAHSGVLAGVRKRGYSVKFTGEQRG